MNKFTGFLSVLFLFLVGCTNQQTIQTDETKEIIKTIKTQYEDIKEIKFAMYARQISIDVHWGDIPSNEEVLGSFELLKQFISSETFEGKIINDVFFTEYDEKEAGYPEIFIYYDFNDDDETDQSFTSSNESDYMKWLYTKDYSNRGDTVIME